jgi:zinc protease
MRWITLLLLTLASTILLQAGELTTAQLPNGLRYIVLPSTASQVVSLELLIDYSALDEPAEYAGVRQVLQCGMLQGSQQLRGDVLDRALTATGGTLSGRTYQDMLEFGVTAPGSALGAGLTALAEMVMRPQLSDTGLWTAIAQTSLQQKVQPVGALETAVFLSHRLLYDGHPYASNVGTAESLARLTPDIVRAGYRQFVTPDRTVLAVVGRCDVEAVTRQLQALFGEWHGTARTPRTPASPPTIAKSRLELREAPVKSTCVLLDFPVCGASQQDFLTLRLIDSLLSGGTGARLFRTVREQRQLAYEVSTNFPNQAACSDFAIYALTQSSELEETKAALVAELSRLQVADITPAELQRAKAYLKGRFLLSHQYSALYAFDLAWYEVLGQGARAVDALPAQIDAITAQDVRRVASAYFTRYYLVVVLPQSVAGRQVCPGSGLNGLLARVQHP